MKRAGAKLTSVLGVSLVLALMASGPADARRGGSFGSRGMRTYQAPPPTRTAPQQTAPVQRSMTQPPKATQPAPAAATAAGQPARRGGFLGGMGGGLLGGLVAGGLIGMMLGNGFGGMGAGLANTLMQVALIGGGIWLVTALLRRRRAGAAFAGAAAGPARAAYVPHGGGFDSGPARASGGFQAREAPPPAYEPQPEASHDIGLMQSDRDTFERLLGEIQDAFGREDYGALRERTTPEIMSFLSEELSQNAVQGRRNQVSGTRLLQADVAEAWREAGADYATAALRYESIDVMRERQSGAVLEGDPDSPTETTELWTFVRRAGDDWKLSAIQEA